VCENPFISRVLSVLYLSFRRVEKAPNHVMADKIFQNSNILYSCIDALFRAVPNCSNMSVHPGIIFISFSPYKHQIFPLEISIFRYFLCKYLQQVYPISRRLLASSFEMTSPPYSVNQVPFLMSTMAKTPIPPMIDS